MRKDDPQINLRVPPELKERIQKAAKENRRTQTAEMLARLQESFDREDNPADFDTAAFHDGDISQVFEQLRNLEKVLIARYGKNWNKE